MDRMKCTCTTCECSNPANDTGWCKPCAAGWHKGMSIGKATRRDWQGELDAANEALATANAARDAAEAEGGVYLGALRACKTALLDVWAQHVIGSPTEQALFKIMDGIDAATKDEPTMADYAAQDAAALRADDAGGEGA